MADDRTALPVLSPAVPPPAARPPSARAWGSGVVTGVALLLGLVAVAGAAASLVTPPIDRWLAGRPDPAAPRRAAPLAAPDLAPRVARLRDRLARGLRSAQRKDGSFGAQADGVPTHEALENLEATALAAAGLGAAVRLGCEDPEVAGSLRRAIAVLRERQAPAGGFGPPARANRGLEASLSAAATLAFSLAPSDAPEGVAFEREARHLVQQAELGSLARGWVQAIASRAIARIAEMGRADLLPPGLAAGLPRWDLGSVRDARDSRVSEAVAVCVQRDLGGHPSAVPEEVFSKVAEDPPAWTGPRLDVSPWVMAAWLAARVPEGGPWYLRALGALEAAVGEDGTIPGEVYGSPASRAGCALLLLWEGTLPPPGT